MASCPHLRTESREVLDQGMHCSGWTCLNCDQLATGECHHRSWCQVDFCGTEPRLDAVL